MNSAFGYRKLHGVGLGLRRVFLQEFRNSPPTQTDFFELAPENWIHVHGKSRDLLDEIAAQLPMVCHGLSLNLGGQAPLDLRLLSEVRDFLNRYNVLCYSEHLSYSSDDGHLYDLLPIPFTAQAVNHVGDRIKRVQDFLGQQLAVENVSYYCAPGQEMPEIDFLQQVLEAADCSLLLDINNVYVNSVNQNYNAQDFLTQVPTQRIAYGHIAGHRKEQEDLLIDTHGADVVDPVWDLLDRAYAVHGVFPTLLERDFNIPALQSLKLELQQIQDIQIRHQTKHQKMSTGV